VKANARLERGAALLIAMLTVALVATFAAGALWQQYRTIEVETAERARMQSDWIITGALDWARLVLREDARASSDGSDWLGEPWAVPLEEARLSSFLAADANNTADTEAGVLDAFLSGQITDLQSRLNVANLVIDNKLSDSDYAAFARLFESLGLPASELSRMAENFRFAWDTSTDNISGAQAPLRPRNVEQLAWLGLSPTTVAALAPYVTVLDARTTVNLNTAPAEVIAAVAGVTLAEAQSLVAARARSHFRTMPEAMRLLPSSTVQAGVAVQSSYFEVRSRLRLEALVVEETAVLYRNGLVVTVLRRERGLPAPAPGTNPMATAVR
jgi:general secretion pathway protein K